MNTTSVVKASRAITARIIANTRKSNSSKNKVGRPSSKRETCLSSEDETAEVPETQKMPTTQKNASSDPKVATRHSKTILRTDPSLEGLFPSFREIITAVGVANWKSEWSEWDEVDTFLCSKLVEKPSPSTKTFINVIEKLKTEDPFLYGVRTFFFVYLCQLNPSVRSLKTKYATAYWMLSY